MNTKRRTTGFGRSFGDIPIIVNKPFDKFFKDANWAVISEDEKTTTFEYTCPNGYAGDDETIVYSLYRDCPEGFDPTGEESSQMTIDWDNAVY